MAKEGNGGFVSRTFCENNGTPSLMRLAVFLIIGTILFNWTYFNVTTGQMSALGYSELLTILGTLLMKGHQKKHEP